ncbi:MAG: hypothetical protein CMA11_06350 [Euryarchaeota archaeon]|nr:hypothetical protein [Euryarchaeota archaeon]
MTTQATTAIVGNAMMSKSFAVTATDGVWDGNIMIDTVGSNPLGILIPGQVIDKVCVQYTAGACAWRIIDSNTMVVKRRGLGALASYSDNQYCTIQPYTVQKTDTLQVFPVAVDATANQSNVLMWVQSRAGIELYYGTDIVDATATEIKTAVNAQGVGDSIFGSAISSMTIQAEDGATITNVELFDASGGLVYTAYGTKRGLNPGSRSNYFNLHVDRLGLNIGKAFVLKVTTVSA